MRRGIRECETHFSMYFLLVSVFSHVLFLNMVYKVKARSRSDLSGNLFIQVSLNPILQTAPQPEFGEIKEARTDLPHNGKLPFGISPGFSLVNSLPPPTLPPFDR